MSLRYKDEEQSHLSPSSASEAPRLSENPYDTPGVGNEVEATAEAASGSPALPAAPKRWARSPHLLIVLFSGFYGTSAY